MRRRDAGLTLVEVTAGVTMLGVVVALIIPAMAHSARFKKVLVCSGQLHEMAQTRAKLAASTPQELGVAYWKRLTETTPPLLSKEALHCPLADEPDAPPISYLGPADDLGKYEAKDPIGCDQLSNHSDNGREGGNILLKSGEVINDRSGTWGTAVRYGKCRP
jgi:hypothetical protein